MIVCGPDADVASSHAPRGADLFVHRPDDIAWRGKADAVVAAVARGAECVDADQAAVEIDECTAAAARIDRSVGLHVDHRRLRFELARHRADDAERHRILQAQRTPDGQHQLSRRELLGVSERQRGQVGCRDPDHREVGFFVDADDLRVRLTAARREHGLSSRCRGNLDPQPSRAGNDVRVGDDVAVASDDDARAGRALRRDQICRLRNQAAADRIRRREDLYDRG